MVKMRKRRYSKKAKLVYERSSFFPFRRQAYWYTGKELIRAEGAVGAVKLNPRSYLDLKTGAIFKPEKRKR